MQNKKGFTLIELMIVVAIIAILAMIAVPMYQRYIERARNNAAQAMLQQLATAQIARTTTGNDFFTVDTIANLGALLPDGFRPDPNVGIRIAANGESFIMAAAHRAVGSTVYIYDNVSGSGVVAFDDASSSAHTALGTGPLNLYQMDAAGSAVVGGSGSGGSAATVGQVTWSTGKVR